MWLVCVNIVITSFRKRKDIVSEVYLMVVTENEVHEMTKPKIMVVEDEVSLRKLESIFLSSRGYLVCEMCNGEEALDSIETEMPDLVLLDVMMPGVDGYEVCRQIKANPLTKHIPIVLLTARKGEDDIAKGEEVKADRYLTKPFKTSVVLEVIKSFLINDHSCLSST